METTNTLDRFPLRIVIIANLVSLLIYGSGIIITLQAGLIMAVLYLVFVLALEYRLISTHCVNCYYWGKICGFGKGWISGIFFTKGDPLKFCSKKMSWKNMVPDLLVTLIPLTIGILYLIIEFNFILLISMIVLIASTTIGNAFIRGTLTCRLCKQRELGCPAEKLFSNAKESQQI